MEYTLFTQMSILNHHKRPNFAAYVDYIFKDFIELSGDRLYGDDPSILGGVASLDGIWRKKLNSIILWRILKDFGNHCV